MNKIKILRAKNKISLKQLAEKTGLSIGYLSHLENGSRNNPSKETMERIAKALGETVHETFFPEERKGYMNE
ncbi:XRE family transcriptional regulator [Biomaibacter acetigenes]|uniref:XRE family transcriptional regulator n=1 Tax=Biomaibacter acetigenes TaxID=2316383 RepID=A0A3G2R4A9_9FIRM|nr:helix-turn-helix transcriptional regulator [Biomaibacter acetigenes]AYO30219.1 XRE family transcriptional regulator [Biomaibacter acetigenes]